ncbi:MAG TPA: propionyl-CoA synthetase [Stellaceae bacterium]|jgi:propionyl-CoA synthetase|nr:propionyl-CoA synthetase [Stellaceae bacterium]
MPTGYAETYRRSLERPEEFWAEAAEAIDWERRWDQVLDCSRPPFSRWFPGARLNTCWNALDRHVAAGNGERTALIWDSPVSGEVMRFTYRRLRDEVALLAGVLAGLGVGKGDRVLIYMPMVPQAAMAMLACARIGAIHSVVFGGFVAHELATRIDAARPRAILAASCGIEVERIIPYKPLLDAAIAEAKSKPEHCLVLQRPMCRADLVAGHGHAQTREHDWDELAAAARPTDCVPVLATDPLYILYTSGTTGIPKGVVRDNGGHAVALRWSLPNIYGVAPDEVFWTASDVGWVVGHSYIVYAPLLLGCTTVMYEGKPVGTPDAGAFWRVIGQHGVRVFFTAPTAFRAIKREDPDGQLIRRHDLGKFRALFLAGERADPPTVAWAEQHLGVAVIDHWWQTETGWPIAANCLGIERLPVKHGSATRAVPGWDVRVLDAEHEGEARDLAAGQIGALAVKLPLPPGALPTLWQADEHFVRTYLSAFPGFYQTADAGFIDADGYIHVMTRTDDIINVAGHRLSTGGIEEVLASHPDVAECAVIGVADALKGQVPLGLLVVKAGAARAPAEIEREAVALVRQRIGPVASLRTALVVAGLPKTRSGKILRGTMRKIADGEDYPMPATIDDPAVLGEIRDALGRAGYARRGAA